MSLTAKIIIQVLLATFGVLGANFYADAQRERSLQISAAANLHRQKLAEAIAATAIALQNRNAETAAAAMGAVFHSAFFIHVDLFDANGQRLVGLSRTGTDMSLSKVAAVSSPLTITEVIPGFQAKAYSPPLDGDYGVSAAEMVGESDRRLIAPRRICAAPLRRAAFARP